MMTTSWTTPLTGTAALITGASSGIGEATARRLAEHGAAVALVARRRDRLEALARDILEAGGAALVIDADITDPAQAETAVRQTVEHFGRLDTLVNNAGITKDRYIAKMSLEDFETVLAVSLRGAWLGTRAVSTLFREQRGGVIVNMSSLSGKIGNPGQTNYSAAKAGLIGLTKASAKELGPAGVRVNAVQPGLVRTAMTLAMKPEIFAAKEAEVPLGRAGEPAEVAGAVVFLASPLASYVNGAVLEVTGRPRDLIARHEK